MPLSSTPLRRALLRSLLLALVLLGGSASAAAPDSKYTAAGLRAAFKAVCQKVGYRIQRLEVDERDQPALVCALLEGKCHHDPIRDELRSMPGYAYNFCQTVTMGDGSKTLIVLDLIPRGPDAPAVDPRRLQARMQQLTASMMRW